MKTIDECLAFSRKLCGDLYHGVDQIIAHCENVRQDAIDILTNEKHSDFESILKSAMHLRSCISEFERTITREYEPSIYSPDGTEYELTSRWHQYLCNVGAELRNPLSVVVGFAKAHMDGRLGPIDDRQLQFFSRIYELGYEMVDLPNKLVEFVGQW